jgi:predicted DNA-binding protein (MmcQ/YjbR family)
MNIDWVRKTCLAFPHATEEIQWEYALVFKVGGKMFAVARLEPGPVWLSFKCSDEAFAELTERPHIVPAPYLARAKWVGLEAEDAISTSELDELLKEAHRLIFEKLPKAMQAKFATAKNKNEAPRKSPSKRERSKR